MVAEGSLLVALIKLVDRIPTPPPAPAKRGRPVVYPDRLFLKALVLMIVRHLSKVQTLLSVLDEPTPEMAAVRLLLTDQGCFPSRRTWERRLRGIPDALPAQIGCLGRHLVAVLVPWPDGGQAAAIDSTVLAAHGGVWHKQHREAGVVPHSSIDTQAGWTKSGWHGWVYGWKLHLVTTVAAVWLPLAATLTPANRADNEEAPALVAALPEAVHFLLGDTAYNDPDLRTCCEQVGCELVPSRRGAYPHTDGGVEVRRIFHQLRSHAIENLNGQFKDIFDCQAHVPTRGLRATRRYILGAVLVYQLSLLYRFEAGLDLRLGLKPFLKAV
ncbi:MAG: transposase [Chloroflexota bacterium]